MVILPKYGHNSVGENFLRSEGFESTEDFCLWFNEDFNGALLVWGDQEY